MIPGQRPSHQSPTTRNMVQQLPSWMKIREADSKGSRFLEAVVGRELDLLYRTLDVYSQYVNIVDSPPDSPTEFWELQLDRPVTSGYITPIFNGGPADYKIEVVDTNIAFLSNPPTRMVATDSFVPSGVQSGIYSLEWINGSPTGMIVAQDGVRSIDPSSTLYYSVATINNEVTLIPYSGANFGTSYIGLEQNSSYEIVSPEPSWSLTKKYPNNVWITPTGDVTSDPGYSPFYSSYLDGDGNKIYHWKALNNPYGSGVYNHADVNLTFAPQSGTIIVYDILNLTTSGTPTVIPASGIKTYNLISGLAGGSWMYQGYESTVPESIAPQEFIDDNLDSNGNYVPVTANEMRETTWQILPVGGYVDDEVYPHSGTFNWISGTGDLGTTLRFVNGASKYQVEYSYTDRGHLRGLSSQPKDPHSSAAAGGGVLYFVDSNPVWKVPNIELSESYPIAVRVDPKVIRPGSTVSVMGKFNTRRVEQWFNAQTTNKTVQFVRHNMGYSDDFGSI